MKKHIKIPTLILALLMAISPLAACTSDTSGENTTAGATDALTESATAGTTEGATESTDTPDTPAVERIPDDRNLTAAE